MKSKALRNSARGQECAFQIVGVCNFNEETTVLAHLPDESNGMGKKSDDISAAFACSSCHDAIDGRAKCSEYQEHKYFYNHRAMVRTWRRWVDEGLIMIKGLK